MSQGHGAGRPRLLIVEDEALIAAELRQRLTRNGYRVVDCVDTADAAIAAAGEHAPDIVLMDIRLKGGGDGVEAARIIHEFWAIPVVFLTANADQATFQRACNTAPYGYVLKPFSEHDLLMALDLARQRARIDADLRQHSLTFEAISAAVADGIVVTDGDGHVRYCNPAAEHLLGFALNVAVGRLYVDVAPTLRPREALTGVERPAEATLVSSTGEHIPVRELRTALVDPRGNMVGVVYTLTDLRELHRSEEARRSSDALARLAFEASPVAMALLDARGELLRVNPSFGTLLGWPTEPPPRGRADGLVMVGDRVRFAQALRTAPAERSGATLMELSLRHAHGHSVTAACSLVRLVADGQPEGTTLWQCQAIDQHKRLITDLMTRELPDPAQTVSGIPFRHVLVVEDEGSLRQIVQRMLERLGLKVTAVGTAGDAMSSLAAAGQDIDLVLTDVVMPGLSGGELARRIGADFPTLRGAFMSGYHDDMYVRQWIEANGWPMLQKPFTSADLRRVLLAAADTAAT
jgi:PAS domain S-box-containing protein